VRADAELVRQGDAGDRAVLEALAVDEDALRRLLVSSTMKLTR